MATLDNSVLDNLVKMVANLDYRHALLHRTDYVVMDLLYRVPYPQWVIIDLNSETEVNKY